MTEPERPRLYLETSVISYLAARPSRDLLVAANQQITHEWWSKQRAKFQVFVSRWVVREISYGDPDVSEARVAIIAGLPRLEATVEAESLAERLIAMHALPRNAADDALHIAVATVNEMDYLLTWNCRHIANARMQKAIRSTCLLAGYDAPIVCTPAELMAE
jgi:hypothetical protein